MTEQLITLSSESLKELAVERLRKAILSGELAPGAKLRINSMCERFGLSATPLREAMSRLVANGLVEVIDQKGFRVVPLSLEDLQDIQLLRETIEVRALGLAITHGDLVWESKIQSALHILQNLDRNEIPPSGEGQEHFDIAHKRFHHALLSACNSPRLMALHNDLHDQIYRYRIILRLIPRQRDVSSQDHRKLAELAIARDIQGAQAALLEHIRLTQIAVSHLSPEQWDRTISLLAKKI